MFEFNFIDLNSSIDFLTVLLCAEAYVLNEFIVFPKLSKFVIIKVGLIWEIL